MFDQDLQRRARRLLAGDRRPEDLDRLYLGLRARSCGFDTVREIGDFVAHRDTRDKGLLTQVGRDVFTSVDVWSLAMRGLTPSWADIGRAADANLRLATDAQLKAGCGCGRASARKRAERALAKIDSQELPSLVEAETLDYVGNRFFWKPAFLAHQLADEFGRLLVVGGLIDPSELVALPSASDFLALHALAVMHGASPFFKPGQPARLLAGFSNRERRLEVKVEIVFAELAMPLMPPICLFLTDLQPEQHCAPSLVCAEDVLVDHWNGPIEVGADGRLTALT